MMNSPPTEAGLLQLQMHALRSSLGEEVHEFVEKARSATDWREYWRVHPGIWCGAAAAIGYFMVPARRFGKAEVQDLVTLAQPAPPAARTSLTRRLLMELAGMAVGFVAQRGMQFAGQQLDAVLASGRQADGAADAKGQPQGNRDERPERQSRRARRNDE